MASTPSSPLERGSQTAQPRGEATKKPIKGQFKQQASQPETRPIDGPSLDDEKLARGHVLDEFKGDAKRPWQRASLSNDTIEQTTEERSGHSTSWTNIAANAWPSG